MPNIVQTVKVVQASDLAFKDVTTVHPALVGKLKYQALGSRLVVECQVKLTAAVTSGAVLGTIPVQCLPAVGTLLRYTSDTDTAPDMRQCRIGAGGVITNTSGLAFNAGHTLLLNLSTTLT